MKDINTVGKKMTRKGPTAAIYKFSFVSEQSIALRKDRLHTNHHTIQQQKSLSICHGTFVPIIIQR